MKVFEWDDLRFFLAVHRGRSVRAASKLLNVSQSTVSRRLLAMEEQLNITLFLRHPEGYVLTEIGAAMVERAERVESEILSMEREVLDRDARPAGLVRISAAPLLAQNLLPSILTEFSELYPLIEVDLDASSEVADLRRRNADIAIRFQSQPDETLVAHRLPDFANSIYATRHYINSHSFSGAAAEAEWVALGNKETLANWRRNSHYGNCTVRHTISDMQAHFNAVTAGLGIGYLLCFIADELQDVERLPHATTQHSFRAWALTHPDLITTERVRICLDFLVRAIHDRKAQIGGQSVA